MAARGGIVSTESDADFFDSVAKVIVQARAYVGRTTNVTMCVTYFEIGRMIVEREQGGKVRAAYGRELLKGLSAYLTARVGRGVSLSNLKNAKKFYLTHTLQIGQSPSALLGNVQKGQLPTGQFISPQKGQSLTGLFRVSWTHYVVLTRIKNPEERRFYELEAESQQWLVDDLKRQYVTAHRV